MKSKVIAVALVAAAGVQLSGCASVVKGSHATIGITTPPAEGAACSLSSPEGTWQVTSPGNVTVSRSKHDVNIKCTKAGYQDAAMTIPSNFEGWTLGNLLIGGVVGIGIDAATGAMNEYPSAFQVPMMPLTASTVSTTPVPAPAVEAQATPAAAAAPATPAAKPAEKSKAKPAT